jgi:hypothetical protein
MVLRSIPTQNFRRILSDLVAVPVERMFRKALIWTGKTLSTAGTLCAIVL